MLRVVAAATTLLTVVCASGDETPPTPPPSLELCRAAMRQLCDGKTQGVCTTCATLHAQQLLKAGCTNDDIRGICESGSLACVNLTVTHTTHATAYDEANSTLQPFHHLSVSHSFPASMTSSTGLSSSMCFSSSDSDSFTYFVSGSQMVGLVDGTFAFAAVALQLRATVDMGALGTSVTLHTSSWTSGPPTGTACPEQTSLCEANDNITALGLPGLHATTPATVVRVGQTAQVTSGSASWQVQFHQICGGDLDRKKTSAASIVVE